MPQVSTERQARRVVVVEDETDIGSLLEYVLGREGFRVGLARNGTEALDALRAETADLVVLDLMLPDMSGLDVLRQIRRCYPDDGPPVIILTALKNEQDRLAGFELGAIDYIVKPFSPRELIYRIRVALSQHAPAAEPRAPTPALGAGPIRIELDNHEATVDGEPLHLTLTEFKLLADLVRNQGRVRTRTALMSEIWGYDSEAMSRTVDTHIRRVRKKLGRASAWLTTVRGVGYRIKKPG